jgi:hypothetical protein
VKVWTNGVDWFIAPDRAELNRIVRHYYGDEFPDEDWDEVAGDQVLTITDYDGKNGTATKTVADWRASWIATEGPKAGLLCSTEY